jgi:hypothetical protein
MFSPDTHSSNHHIYIQYVLTVGLKFHKYHPTVLSHIPSTVTLPVHILLGPTEQFCNCQLLNDQTLNCRDPTQSHTVSDNIQNIQSPTQLCIEQLLLKDI